ncbi:MAG: GNAT family N-acetyltransferase [Streptosporangiales bacterium]|nr:GNAT family N-acetyltransferase [Streptosporangiales bacterium]MBO0889343.1 GNAT family N-acetyltransferase [Acidothermales bacterium]
MSAAAVRVATGADVAPLAALRRTWTEEDGHDRGDADFEQRFARWFTREQAHRVTWLAETDERPIGMLNLLLFERMPRPGRPAGGWAYLANMFVLHRFRNGGVGRLLLDAAVGYATDAGLERIVLHPSERAVPFYERAGFGGADMLLVRHLAEVAS